MYKCVGRNASPLIQNYYKFAWFYWFIFVRYTVSSDAKECVVETLKHKKDQVQVHNSWHFVKPQLHSPFRITFSKYVCRKIIFHSIWIIKFHPFPHFWNRFVYKKIEQGENDSCSLIPGILLRHSYLSSVFQNT